MFTDNTASYGGSIYLTYNSVLTLNGTNLFQSNTSNFSHEVINAKKLSCNNINPMREINFNLLLQYNGSGGVIICNNSYVETYYYSNFTHNIAGQYGGAMALNTCRFNIQGNASFVGNKAYEGGAMVLNTDSNVNGNLFLNKNLAIVGGALSIIGGNFIIKGYTLFDSNHAEDRGGALCIHYQVNFICCGSIYSESNNAMFDPGALPLNKTRAFDTEYSINNALPFNNSITFLKLITQQLEVEGDPSVVRIQL